MKKHKITIVGMGYVGLPLAAAFAEQYPVVGFDIDSGRISELQEGFDRTLELDSAQLSAISDNIVYSNDIGAIADSTVYIITVPTPIDNSNHPDLTPLKSASSTIGQVLKPGDLVIYESTVYPGVTEEVCVPILEESSGLRFNEDFFAGYSPERINPGDKQHTVKTILKVTSGSTPEVAKTVDALYRSVITAGTHLASSIKVAEAAKVVENTQRDVNIALINELALIFDTMGIDTNEVIEAAATKWNFIKLHPGLVGGHCIGVDPYYLTYRAEELGYKPNLILGARHVNNGMSKFIAERTIKLMISHDKKIKNARVLVMGITFKENCPDMRNSKVFDIIDELSSYGCRIDIHDPWVKTGSDCPRYASMFIGNPFEQSDTYDAILVAVAHNAFKSLTQTDFERVCHTNPVIIDIKGIVEKPTWRL